MEGGSDSSGQGLWNCPRVKYSNDTRELLQMMMRESRLSSFQQRQINSQLKKGGVLPLVCNPASSGPETPPPRVWKGPALSARPQRRSSEKCSVGNTPEKFRPSATRDLEKEKHRLQNIFATGQEQPQATPSHPPPGQRGQERETDRFQEVVDEIEERRRFLEEMDALGRGRQYRHIINTQISQKLRELEQLDRALGEDMRTLLFREREKDECGEGEQQL